ncbi:hypothetical protein Pint_26904 [Pistacia integerrima]|uniref:Uncharacterized protein n=1 Tax=Pistacia integerrima TaxID=434235 RepID=A0ACC0YUD0_9ROSI|nr:hypothetical protein Pint_26904 [Pistacia integerrima]
MEKRRFHVVCSGVKLPIIINGEMGSCSFSGLDDPGGSFFIKDLCKNGSGMFYQRLGSLPLRVSSTQWVHGAATRELFHCDALYSLRSNLLDPNNVLQNWDPTVGNPCTWFHVTCNSENSVTRVDLGNAELSGELVPELGQLKNLRYLELFSNSITGQIPSALGNLTNLVSLNLSSNGFTGPIPDSFGKLTKLRILELSSNNITGQIPSALGNLKNLVSLDLSLNSFTGPIPDSFGKLTKLHILELSSNNITGQIPSALGNLTNLVSLDLSLNSFTGPIPDSFGKLTKLDILDLSNNRLSGLIPTNGSFSLLTPMSFANNILVWPVTWGSSSQSLPPPYVPGKNSPTGAIAGAVSVGSALLFAALAVGFAYWWRRKPQGCFFDAAVEEDPEVQLGQLKRFSLRELQFVTNNFRKKNILGRGGFGKVYKGCLADGTLVAVKRLKEEQTVSGESQFQTEVEMISMAVHRNLLPLRGFCMTSNERLLVYPYMANGSVASCLRELITGERSFDLARFANDGDDVMLLDWVRGLLKEKKLDMLVDPELLDNYLDIEVERLVQLALLCTQESSRKRPKMSKVVRMLEGDGLVEKWEEWQEGEVVRHEVERIHRKTIFERDSFVIPKIFVL